ncbi:inositol monophosphatase family protein [Bartonella sp. MF74HXZ]|uniref:inositol monophosphatase family protein n=1 Tax=Bartonella sp. MF74HXZ TaxID=1461006 RepID=UPI0035D0BAA7
MREVAGFCRLNAAALDLAYVAAGKTDGFWEDNLQIFDRTTGILMVRKTGGFVTDKEGNNIFRKNTSLPEMNTFASNYKKSQKRYLTLTVFYKTLRTLKNHMKREFLIFFT